MEKIYEQIVILKVEILRSETEPYHYQHTSHTLNNYDPEHYNKLFAKLQVVERLYGDLKSLMGEFKKEVEVIKDD